jgi:hypothetical protein
MSENKIQKNQVRLRPATESDVPFIFNSWLRCYRHSLNTRGCENPVFFAQHHKVLEGICKQAEVIIACNVEDISQIYGYIAHEKTEDVSVIHFIYVKEIYRKFGLSNILLEAIGVTKDTPFFYTHRTFVSESLEKKFKMIYNPYLSHYAYNLAKDEPKHE